jgi:hypothetical protein
MSKYLEAEHCFQAVRCAEGTLLRFTTVRDLGGTGVNISIRNMRHLIKRSTYFLQQENLYATTGGHTDQTSNRKLVGDQDHLKGINSPEEAVKAVRAL